MDRDSIYDQVNASSLNEFILDNIANVSDPEELAVYEKLATTFLKKTGFWKTLDVMFTLVHKNLEG